MRRYQSQINQYLFILQHCISIDHGLWTNVYCLPTLAHPPHHNQQKKSTFVSTNNCNV